MNALVLAQRMEQAEAVRQILIGSGVLIAAVLVLFAIVYWVRRRFTADDSQSGDHGFTLHDLRTLHARGELTDDEFHRARDAMISRVRGSTDDDETGDEAGDATPPDPWDDLTSPGVDRESGSEADPSDRDDDAKGPDIRRGNGA